MAYGEIYVEVDASVVGGGIMPMAIISGNPEPIVGQESFGVWLLWYYDDETGNGGFSGTGWYVNDENNPIHDKYNTEEEFKQYLVSEKPTDLNNLLGNWGGDRKSAFFYANQASLGSGNCFSFTSGNG